MRTATMVNALFSTTEQSSSTSMTPTTKDPQIAHLLNKLFGRTDAITSNKCVFCQKPVSPTSFRDALSEREYRISGICQTCQDSTFK